jgi:DNA-binding transcriptional LysR family regulator
MNHLHAMRVLIRVAELASFALAAEQLGISASSATRSISLLESDLNVRVLNRSTRKISITDVSHEYLDSARTVIAQLDEMELKLSRANREIHGTLRVVASTTFAERGLFSLLAAYQKIASTFGFLRCVPLHMEVLGSQYRSAESASTLRAIA